MQSDVLRHFELFGNMNEQQIIEIFSTAEKFMS